MEGTVGSRHRQRISQDTGAVLAWLCTCLQQPLGFSLVPKALRTGAEMAGSCVGRTRQCV